MTARPDYNELQLALQRFDWSIGARSVVFLLAPIGMELISFAVFGRFQPLLFREQLFLVPLGLLGGGSLATYFYYRVMHETPAYAELGAAEANARRFSLRASREYVRLLNTKYGWLTTMDGIVELLGLLPLVVFGFNKALVPIAVYYAGAAVVWRFIWRCRAIARAEG